jgi:lipoprotein-anchoring transpeptidase ErfK/SrfK
MARRHASRGAFALLAAASLVAVGVFAFKGGATQKGTDKLLPHEEGPALPVAKIASSDNAPTLLRSGGGNSPTTAPSTPTTHPAKPAVATSFDAEQVFRQAAAKRDNGDLVTARNLISEALATGKLDASDTDAAKTFIGQLNEKIILGTQKFPADAYNKTWKVEPGHVLQKIAKRFDVTSGLLCKINGLSSPNKLRADSTIKTIQGPFHLVVSKSRFEADVYLGNPGGPGSMFVKTFRVGLGSDDSTPTGTWQVVADKLENPVYYSPRGEGVIAADDPKNPLGERWIPLKGVEGDCVGKESYGIHGTIDPDSIGKNMSMGCIRLANEDIVALYDLLIEEKSLVKVVD